MGFIFIFKEKMEEALNEFIEHWKSKRRVVGILLTGSYAVEQQNRNSDIDIRLIINNTNGKSIKGLTTINGYKFSYLGRSAESTKKKFSSDFLNYNKFEARIFTIGKILYDRKDEVRNLIETAKIYLNTPFITKKINKEELNTRMYTIYSYKTYLDSLDEASPYFAYTYFLFMKLILSFYSSYLGYEFFLDFKTEQILTNLNYRNIYIWETFPDQHFASLWNKNILQQNVNKKSVKSIFNYLQKKIVTVNENNFKMTWLEI